MNELKKSGSVALTLVLTVIGAALVAGLFRSLFLSPACYWYLPVFSAVLILLMFLKRHTAGRITLKSGMGALFIVFLVIGLGFGLYSSISYLVILMIRGSIGTSFPWYYGFVFAAYYLWPLWLGTGLTWLVLHLRGPESHIRDLKVLTKFMLFGTALWAVIWTIGRISNCINYPNAYGHPWHASFVYTVLYFGPALGLEGGFLAYLNHRQKHPKKVVQSQPQPEPVKPAPVGQPVKIRPLLADLAIAAVPLAVVAVVMALVWDTGYLAPNIATVLCTAGAVIMMNLLIGWLVTHRFEDSRRLRDLCLINILCMVLTVITAFLWADGFYRNQMEGVDTGHPENFQYLLALGYFGPIILGQALSLVVLWRQEGRDRKEIPEKRTWAWFVLLALVLGVRLYTDNALFHGMVYSDEVDAYPISAKPLVDHPDCVQVTISTDTYIQSFWYNDHYVSDDGTSVYIKLGTRWTPDVKIRKPRMGYNVNYEPDLENVYLYIPGEGYVKVMELDPWTGEWVKVQ